MKKTRDEALDLQEAGDMEARWRGLATQLLELGDDAMDAQLLVAFRAAREEGVVPPDAGFFLVAHILTSMADEAIGDEPRVCRLALELELMEREYGVEQGVWLSGEETPPEDWEALRAAYEAACDEARATFFTAYGEEEMARLYLDDRFCFHRRFESGRRFFHGLPMLPEHLH